MTVQKINLDTPNVKDMTDRELLEEIVASQRATHALVAGFIENMKSNPMMKMMAGKFGG